MKKNLMFAMFGAIALIGAVGFSSCSSNDDVVDVNPTYDPASNTVTTQFVLNIASGEMQSTRQSAATVQKNQNFRGMQNAMLIGLTTGNSSYLAPFLNPSATGLNQQYYDLGTLYAAGSVDNSVTVDDSDPENPVNDYKNASKSSNRVVELQLPLGTDAMLVYGRAIPVSPADDEADGKVTYGVATGTLTPTFALNPRIGTNSNLTKYQNYCGLIAEILNRIMKSGVGAQNLASPAQTWPTSITGLSAGQYYTQKADLVALTWRELGNATGTLVPLEQKLAKAYQSIKTVYTNTTAPHSGSAELLRNMVADLWVIANSVTNAVATNDAEMNAQRLANNIKSRINNYFNPDAAGCPFREIGPSSESGTILYALNSANVNIEDFTGLSGTELESFPSSLKLPTGVAQIKFTEFDQLQSDPTSGGFEYLEMDNSTSLIDLNNKLNLAKYTYPAELLYFDNSALRVNDAEKAVADYPNGTTPWDTEATWTNAGWADGAVATTTRSVAVKNNINYGVAMLNTKVVIDNTEGITFKDNHPAEENVSFSTTELTNLQLTGVLIGGQYNQVGWNFLSTGDGTGGANKNFVIYDNKINTATWSTGVTPENYTLVFDNYDQSGTQQPVYVALEFKNMTGKDIYGKGDGMIPKEATFYLTAKLTIGTNTISSWPTTYAIPPYTADGASQKITRIFVQDYVTTATFKIGATSLQNAYNTVPDLRATQTSLGMSVDLQWRPGLNFSDVVLGTTESSPSGGSGSGN